MKKLEEQYPNWSELTDQQIGLMQKAGIKVSYRKFREYHLEREKEGHLFDYYLKAHCFNINQKLKDNYDHFIVFSGKEGTGKSTLAIKVCSWIDPNFNNEKICFTYEEIIKAVKEGKMGSMILIDEGAISLYSREAMSKVNRVLTKLFMVIRAKCIGLGICIPNFHLLDSYVKDHRTDTLIQVTRRGLYTAYVQRAIKRVSRLGLKFKDISGVKCASGTFWKGSFNQAFPKTIPFEDYNKRKMEHMNKFVEELETDELIENKYIPSSKLAKKMSYTNDAINNMIKKKKIRGKKINNHWYVLREDYDMMANALDN